MARAPGILATGLLTLLLGCGSSDDGGDRGDDPFEKVNPQITKVRGKAAPRWEPIARSGSTPSVSAKLGFESPSMASTL